MIRQVIQQQVQVLFGEELISPLRKSESDISPSDNIQQIRAQVGREEKKIETHQRARFPSHSHTLMPSQSVETSDPSNVRSMLDDAKYRPDRIHSREQSLIRSAAAKAMSKGSSNQTEANRLQSLIQPAEPRETSSDEDYRSAYSQTFNDFAFPVKSSPEVQLQLLKIHCAETASRRSARDSSRGRAKDFSSERSIPNIFDQDPHFTAGPLPGTVLNSNVAVQTDVDVGRAAPPPVSIAT